MVRRTVCERRLAVANNVSWSLACCSLGSCPEGLLALNCVTPSLADHDHMPACARLGAGFDFPIQHRRSAHILTYNANVKNHRKACTCTSHAKCSKVLDTVNARIWHGIVLDHATLQSSAVLSAVDKQRNMVSRTTSSFSRRPALVAARDQRANE